MKLFLMTMTILAGLSVASCGDDDDDSGEPTPTPSAEQPTATPAVTEPGDPCEANLQGPAATGDLTWDAIVPAEIPAPEGWTVSDAEGDAPLLAVNDGTSVVGTLELLQFEVPFDPGGGYPNLEEWANEFYESTQTDRVAGIGSGQGGANPGLTIAFDQQAPAPFGEFCGMAYGYTVSDESGAVIERYDGRVTFDSAKIYLIVGLYDASAPETGFQSAEALAAYEPSLTPLAAALNVPAD